MTEPENNVLHTYSRSLTDFEIFKVLLDTRNFEISLFWQRSNYFLVLNTALAVGVIAQPLSYVVSALCLFGVLASLLWCGVVLGSKYWQARWEQQLSDVETDIAPRLKAFAATRNESNELVKKSLNSGSQSIVRDLTDTLVLRKPSVSRAMTYLAFFFFIGWCGALAVTTYNHAWSRTPPAWEKPSGKEAATKTASIDKPGVPVSLAGCPATITATSNPDIHLTLNLDEQKAPSSSGKSKSSYRKAAKACP